MAYICSATTGNWSSTSTWYQVTNTPTLSTSASANLTTTPVYTDTFTAPNTTNACVGMWIYIVHRTGAVFTNTATVTLQEGGVDTVAVKSLNIVQQTSSSPYWKYFKFDTPYVFTTTAAGSYRFKLVGNSSSLAASADSGGTLVAFLAVDNRNVASVGATDDVYIGAGNDTSTVTVTLDGTQTVGSGTSTSTRALTGLKIDKGGVLSWDTATSAQLTSAEYITVDNDGVLAMGTQASPIPAGIDASLYYGTSQTLSAGQKGYLFFYGTPPTYPKTTLVSGVGTAASPLVVTDSVNWTVGDELVITPTNGSTQDEVRFIITKNSATSYVLSDTLGGSEAAFAYTHIAGCHIVNIKRNILVTTTSSSLNLAVSVGSVRSSFDAYLSLATHSIAYGLSVRGCRSSTAITINKHSFGDYLVATDGIIASMIAYNSTNKTVNSIIAYKFGGTGGVGGFVVGGNGNIFNDVFVIRTTRYGFYTGHANTFNRLVCVGCNTNPFVGAAAIMANSAECVFNDCETHLSYGGVYLTGAVNNIFNNYVSGTLGANGYGDITVSNASFNSAVFNDCTLSSSTLISYYNVSSYQSAVDLVKGSSIGFVNLQGVSNTDYTITKFGYLLRTGDGLTDTTVRTSGTGKFALRFEPTSSTDNLTWDFTVPTGNIQNLTMTVFMWCKINSATYYAGTHQLPRLNIDYDNGTTAYAQAAESTDWQLLYVPFTPTTTYGQITVTVSGRTDATTTNAYFYIDDFGVSYPPNVALDLGGLDNWSSGLPVVPPIALPLSAGTVAQQVALNVPGQIKYINGGELPVY